MPDVLVVGAEAVRPLRHSVLRPMQTLADVVYPGDDDPRALHAAVVEREAVVGVVTVAPEGHPSDPQPEDWRIRGMAAAPEVRGRGIGSELLAACVEHVRGHGGRRIWCNAREAAVSLYARAGFAVEGERFVVDPIGPHYVMALIL